MRILLLTPQLPYPTHQGTTIRNLNIIRQLAPNHSITLLSFGTKEELENAAPLRSLCRRIEIAPYPTRSLSQRAITTLISPLPDMALRLQSKAMHALTRAVFRDESFDIVQIEAIEMADFWISASIPGAPLVVFDDHNAEYMLQRTAYEADARRITRWLAALYSFIQWKKLTRYERGICLRADRVIAASDTDARAIGALGSAKSITVIPNGVDTEYFVPSDDVCAKPLADLAMVYTGKMDFRPNVDAMLWFCDEILPLVRSQIPQAHIVIVGQKPTPRILALRERKGVEVTGWVPDTRPYVADSAIYVVPLRMGSGTRLKVLEAMAMGKAIVSTSRGVEGIELLHGRDVLIADSPQALAQCVVTLLRNPNQRRALGQSARMLARSKYDWRQIIPAFERVYKEGTTEAVGPTPTRRS